MAAAVGRFARADEVSEVCDDLLVDRDDPEGAYERVLSRAFRFAGWDDGTARPIHLLWALSEVSGPMGQALSLPDGRTLAELTGLEDPTRPSSAQSGYHMDEIQEAAQVFAGSRAETLAPAHLFIVVLDHGEPEAVAHLTGVGLDVGALRSVALDLLGAPPDLPPTAAKDVTPSGRMGRPALTVEDLDSRAWRVLHWRQEHLPVDKLRRRSDWDAMLSIECSAAWKIADRLQLVESQRYSLAARHGQEVTRIARDAKPLIVPPERPADQPRSGVLYGPLSRRRPRVRLPNFMTGWPSWFGNRLASVRVLRMAILIWPTCRHQPNP